MTNFITKNHKKIPIKNTGSVGQFSTSTRTITEERMKNPEAFAKARKDGFNAVNFVNKELSADLTPAEKLEKSAEVRKGHFELAVITPEEKALRTKLLRLGKERVNAMIHGGKRTPLQIWQEEKKATIQLAKIQNNKLREGFAES